MSTQLIMKITAAGYNALANQKNTGLMLDLTHFQFGSGNRVPDGSEQSLLNPKQASAITDGQKLPLNGKLQLRMSALFEGTSSYPISEIGVWSGAPGAAGSVLFAYWSQASGKVAEMSVGVDFFYTHDMPVEAAVGAALNIIIDPNSSTAVALMHDHEQKVDPHPQYMTQSKVSALIEARVGDYALDTGAANAYVVAMNPAVTQYNNGMEVSFRVAHPNTGPSTLDAGGGQRPLTRSNGTSLQDGDLTASSVASVVYNLATDSFLVKGIVGSQVQAIVDAALTRGFANAQTFLANGTFVVPAGVSKVFVTGCAGGGGGGAYLNSSNGAGGGGGGASCVDVPFAVVPGASIAVTIGSGGAGGATAGTSGSAGGATSFGTLITMSGGGGGVSAGIGGAGGTVTPATSTARSGQNGEQYNRNSAITSGGWGGGSMFGVGGFGGGTTATAGFGSGYGTGGGGGGAGTGSDGRPGFLIVKW